MPQLMGYSQDDGYCVHDDSGISWGQHPENYKGPLVFLEDNGVVTAIGRQATEKQMTELQDHPIDWEGDIPYEEAVVTAETALECLVMLHEGKG